MVPWASLTKSERKTLRKAEYAMDIRTANGVVHVDHIATVYCRDLDVKVDAYILNGSPALLSAGKLCKENGFEWTWGAFSENPVLVRGALRVECAVVHDVPIVVPACIAPGLKEETVPIKKEITQEATPGESPSTKQEATPSAVKQEATPGKKPDEKEKKGRPERYKKKKKRSDRVVACKPCEHNPFTHFPKDPNCEICNNCKAQRSQCRAKVKVEGEPDKMAEPTEWLGSITADHEVLNKDHESRESDQNVLICHDRYTGWTKGFPQVSASW